MTNRGGHDNQTMVLMAVSRGTRIGGYHAVIFKTILMYLRESVMRKIQCKKTGGHCVSLAGVKRRD